MRHMAFDKMTGSESSTEGEFTGKNTSSDDAGEFAGVVTWVCWVRAADAKHIEHGGLGLENGSATNSTNFNGRHGDGDLEVAAETGGVS